MHALIAPSLDTIREPGWAAFFANLILLARAVTPSSPIWLVWRWSACARQVCRTLNDAFESGVCTERGSLGWEGVCEA